MASIDESYLIASSSTANADILPSNEAGAALCWAQQKSGVHFTQTTDATTLASLAVGPSFQTRTAPATGLDAERKTRWTAVVPAKEKQRIWTWHAGLDRGGGFASDPSRQSHETDHQPVSLLAIPDQKLLYASEDSKLALCDVSRPEKMTAQCAIDLPATPSPASIRISADASSSTFVIFCFIPSQKASPSKSSKKSKQAAPAPHAASVHLHLVQRREDDQLELLGSAQLPQSDLVDASYSFARQIVTSLSQDGVWRHYHFQPLQNHLELIRELPLASRFAFSPSASEHHYKNPSFILSLHDSFAVLALPTSDSILCTVWDLVHGVCLAESSQLAGKPTLVSNFEGLATLLISSSTDTRIYAVPYTLPQQSTLSLVVGRAKSTEDRYLNANTAFRAQQKQEREDWRVGTKHPLASERRAKLDEDQHQARTTLVAKLESSAPAVDVDDLFGSWLAEETSRLQSFNYEKRKEKALKHPAHVKAAKGQDKQVKVPDNLPETPTTLSLLDKSGQRFQLHAAQTMPPLPSAFITAILDIGLASNSSQKTLRYLMERHAVQDAMVEPTIVQQLHKQNSPLLDIALQNVRDVSEHCLVSVFKSSAGGLHATRILSRVISYPSSAPALRQALADLTSEQLVFILTTVQTWLNKSTEQLPDPKPPLDRLTAFLSSLIDVHFVTLLQNAAVHDLVLSLQRDLRQVTLVSGSLAGLNGSLDMIEREHERAFRKTWDSRERKQMLRAQKEMIEDYQVEVFEV